MLVLDKVRDALSCALLGVALVAVGAGVVYDANVAQHGGPLVEGLLLVCALALLYLAEGFQVCVLGLRNLESGIVDENASKLRNLVFPESGVDNLSRLFLGQSFLVVLATFLIAQLTSFRSFPHLPDSVAGRLLGALLSSGLAGIIIMVNLAQLLPSTLAQRYPRRWANCTPLVYRVCQVALVCADSGIVHCTFLIVDVLERLFFKRLGYSRALSDHTDTPDAPAPDSKSAWFFRLRVFFSTLLFLASAAYVCFNIAEGRSSLASSALQPALIFFLVAATFCVVFYAEGELSWVSLMIGYSSAQCSQFPHFPHLYSTLSLTAYVGLKIGIVGSGDLTRAQFVAKGYNERVFNALHGAPPPFPDLNATRELQRQTASTKEEGHDQEDQAPSEEEDQQPEAQKRQISKFLLGRQMMCVPCGFLLSNLFLFSGYDQLHPFAFFLLVGLGLPGMLFAMQLVQLAPQVLAGKYPAGMLSLPFSASFVRVALAIEKLGITQSAFLISHAIMPPGSAPVSSESESESRGNTGHNPLVSGPMPYAL